jgi:acyl phosphate:glycerol-3-phosphate acyltransferase
MLQQYIISALVGYAFGNIQVAYLIGRKVGKIDIREHGSHNAGTSNITTIMGIKYGIVVGLIDILKGMFAVLTIKWLYPAQPNLALLSGILAVLGHIFPFYMGFRGGKGVAALIGVMFGLDWKLGVLFALLVAVPALITDYIVMGSFATFLALPVVIHLSGYPIVFTLVGVAMAGLIFYLHRHNIRRIRNKEEVKVSEVLLKKKK